MANVFATHSVSNSLISHLRDAYPEALRATHPFDFRVLSSGELATGPAPSNTLALLLFQITQNEHPGSRSPAPDPPYANPPLTIDLHYLLTAWAADALAEQTIISWAMRELQMHPVLDGAQLTADAAWQPTDMVQVIPAELSKEELSHVWELLQQKYRLSVSYIARSVKIDTDTANLRPVVATRYGFNRAAS